LQPKKLKKSESNQQSLPKPVLDIIRMKVHLVAIQKLRKV
jgi:hypothetical protein